MAGIARENAISRINEITARLVRQSAHYLDMGKKWSQEDIKDLRDIICKAMEEEFKTKGESAMSG